MRHRENGLQFFRKAIYQDEDEESNKMKKNGREKECERNRKTREREREREESIFTGPSGVISILWQKCQKIERPAGKMNSLNLCV